ncbi:MAG: helix-turn-helix transcriptional regulator [Clostridia bacterium]|nr:helix-turn-helix transcriptional regulator [Clostridia bacterium]
MLCITISYRIKQYRREHKISQERFGDMVGVSAQAVSKWERQLSYPDIMLWLSLSKILSCNIEDFFEEI